MRPRLLASHRRHHWTLPETLSADGLGFGQEGSGSLLLIAMHTLDERPWTCARHPLLFAEAGPGFIDLATKRILGKRFGQATGDEASLAVIDPIATVLGLCRKAGHDFRQSEILWPEIVKEPGKLLPRPLRADLSYIQGGERRQLFSRNFTELSQCLHAELVLLFALGHELDQASKSGALEDFRLHCTLKPCRMCAAFLHSIKDRCQGFRVSYEHEDPGPLAANTLLDQHGYTVMPK